MLEKHVLGTTWTSWWAGQEMPVDFWRKGSTFASNYALLLSLPEAYFRKMRVSAVALNLHTDHSPSNISAVLFFLSDYKWGFRIWIDEKRRKIKGKYEKEGHKKYHWRESSLMQSIDDIMLEGCNIIACWSLFLLSNGVNIYLQSNIEEMTNLTFMETSW